MIRLNNTLITPTIFPDKTSQVWNIPLEVITPDSVITWEFENEAEFLHVAQLKRLVSAYENRVMLRMPYLPYARQDKIISNDQTFALSAFATILNSLEFAEVVSIDVHSSKAFQIIKNFESEFPDTEVEHAIHETNAEMLCFPDHGASTRYAGISNLPAVIGSKVRDPKTGRIVAFQITGYPLKKRVLIVDDICDGGATFQMAAAELLFRGATEVNLYVSHGIFSKGFKELKESGIKRFFTYKGELNV